MKNIARMIAALLVCLLVLGGFPTSAQADAFDFALPEGMHIPEELVTDTDCPIICAGQRIGGFLLTELPLEALMGTDTEPILQYLERYNPPDPLVSEHMMGWGNGVVDVSLIFVDKETRKSREFMHFFFEMDGGVYDLWLDLRYVDDDLQRDILTSVGGILPNGPVIEKMPPVYNFDFSLPEGFTLGTPEGDSCPILFGGVAVGGFCATNLTDRMLMEDDNQFDMNDYLPEEEISYGEQSGAEFAITRLLSQGLPETSGYEYILMYGSDSQGLPMVSVSWKVTDYETGDAREFGHTLFIRDNTVYDLWLDYSLLDRDTNYGFLAAAGIE